MRLIESLVRDVEAIVVVLITGGDEEAFDPEHKVSLPTHPPPFPSVNCDFVTETEDQQRHFDHLHDGNEALS